LNNIKFTNPDLYKREEFFPHEELSQTENLEGYSKEKLAYFDTIEKASSLIKKRDFFASENNYFNISTPNNWNIEGKKFNIESYHKNQTIQDSGFNIPRISSPWNKVKNDYLGGGTITQSFEPGPLNPEYVLTHMEHSSSSVIQPGFHAWQEFAFWNQTLRDLNPQGMKIQNGLLYQERDEHIMGTNFSNGNNFNTDMNSPYGGSYRGSDNTLFGEEGDYLYMDILPDSGALGGNPSAAWWSYVKIPYQVDYAQIKISWKIDEQSSFEASDDYRVCARINNRYIDGRDWIEKDDTIPLNGSENALIVYNNQWYIEHDYITRTYEITDLINGTIGINKFDFGGWAKNPSHSGQDTDNMLIRFDSVELMYNVSDKYEIAQLDFDYRLIDYLSEEDPVDVEDPNKIVNDASIFMVLENSTQRKTLKVLPFNSIREMGSGSSDIHHMVYSISQEYLNFLKSNNFKFYLGVIFEKDIYNDMDIDLYFDNVKLKINYEHPNTGYSGLQVNIDDEPSNWEDVFNNSIDIDTSSWTAGENHTFRFRTLNSSFNNKLYLNFKSELDINLTKTGLDAAYANYEIQSENYDFGYWEVLYNNNFSYSGLESLNFTSGFNLSMYEINYLDFPAFDNKGTLSENWDVIEAISPNLENFTNNLELFNYSQSSFNQSARINEAFQLGNWTIRALQNNYITSGTFNISEYYEGKPVIYRNSTFEYNYTLATDQYQDYTGSYNITIVNSTGGIMNSYPKNFLTSKNQTYLVGSIDIPISYNAGTYFFSIRWNDKDTIPQSTLRFGSNLKTFLVVNATYAGFTKENITVQPGEVGNFSLFYRIKYSDWGINTTNIWAYENSTGEFRLWGVVWSGSYQFSYEYLGEGNYSAHLDTITAPNNNYTVKFVLFKSGNQHQNLISNLQVDTNNIIEVQVTEGAYRIKQDHYQINDNNVPYVNDTVNSIIQLNLTEFDGTAITKGTVIGRIGEKGGYFEAKEIYNQIPIVENLGIYNLTLDTTGLNATLDNITLLISCSAKGFKLKELTVNLSIHKIPTAINLQQIQSTYEEGEITVRASINNYITPDNPKPNNKATLNYFIVQNSTVLKTGLLEFLWSGVYSKEVVLSGLKAGNYTVYVNGTALNCQDSTSNTLNIEILPQESTQIQISFPDIIRILKPFNIKATLSHINGTNIPFQTINLNITRVDKDLRSRESLYLSYQTDENGDIFYNEYIIPEDYKDGLLTINASFEGKDMMKASASSSQSIVSGKIPLVLSIIDHPNNTARVGYSATYRVKINISDSGEIVKNRIIIFNALYENIDTPFITTQLYTNEDGECEYTISQIANGYTNITVYFEYLGSSTVTYNYTTRSDLILPKWKSNFSLNQLPSVIRHGQEIDLDLTFWSPENLSLSFEGLPVSFEFKHGGKTEFYTKFISENNSYIFSYMVADSFDTNLNITIIFSGNSRIQGRTLKLSLTIQEKLSVFITFIKNPSSQYFQGNQFISVQIKDSLNNSLKNVDVLFELYKGEMLIDSAIGTTNDNGIASVSLDFSQVGDNFNIKVSFLESGYYQSSELISSQIRIVNEFIIFMDYLPYILMAMGIIVTVSLSIYRGVIIPRRKQRRESLKKMYQRLSDIENIQYVLILTKDGGIPVFSKSLADVPIDESLVSGFLSAISSFGEEIGSKMKKEKGGLEQLSYRQFKIILDEGKFVRTALLLLKRPSETLKEKLKKFNNIFEAKFKDRLVNYSGEVFDDSMVMKYIENIFEADLLYPHQIVESRVSEYLNSRSKRALTNKIIISAKSDEFESSFYLRDMINHLKTKGIEEIKSFEALERLKNKDIIFAINPRTNYLIEQLQPIINSLTQDDREVLFASFENNIGDIEIKKYLKQKKYEITGSLNSIISKLMELELLKNDGHLSEAGNAIATLLKLIPDL
jgi:hypothetical protein